MQFSESWLRTFCNPAISTAELAETLTMAGLEVEELKPVAPPFTKIVSAAHPMPASAFAFPVLWSGPSCRRVKMASRFKSRLASYVA